VKTRQGSYLGRYQQGQRVPLGLRTVSPGSVPALPDAAPVADIYSDSGLVASVALPLVDRAARAFILPFALGRPMAWGRYRVAYRYSVGGVPALVCDTFEVVAGGTPTGRSSPCSATTAPRPATSWPNSAAAS
jgi:hypothetical protein